MVVADENIDVREDLDEAGYDVLDGFDDPLSEKALNATRLSWRSSWGSRWF